MLSTTLGRHFQIRFCRSDISGVRLGLLIAGARVKASWLVDQTIPLFISPSFFSLFLYLFLFHLHDDNRKWLCKTEMRRVYAGITDKSVRLKMIIMVLSKSLEQHLNNLHDEFKIIMTPAVRRGITLSNAKQVLPRIAILNLAHTGTDVIFSRVMTKFNAFFNYLHCRNWPTQGNQFCNIEIFRKDFLRDYYSYVQ